MKFSGEGYKNSIAEESRRLQNLFLKLNFFEGLYVFSISFDIKISFEKYIRENTDA
jgi:hypothetical protein